MTRNNRPVNSRAAALGAGLFGGSGVVAVYGAGCLLACAIIAISGVAAAWPEQAVAGVKADNGAIKEKERAHR
jgi:hypothetical protein